MIKKTIIMACALVLASSTVFAAETSVKQAQTNQPPRNCQCQRPPKGPDFVKRNAEFEKRLKLTDEQKAKAEAIRKKGFEQMKPVMQKIHEKKGEIEGIKKSKLLERDKQAQI